MTTQDPIHLPYTVLIDGREQAAWHFTDIRADAKQSGRPLAIRTAYAHLRTGDYTIAGLEDSVAVERKSLEDLYSTLGSGRERFEREHERLAEMKSAAVIIEASWEKILQQPPARSKLAPKTILRTMVSWQVKYGVPWWAMDCRRLAEITAFRFLDRFWRFEKEVTKDAEVRQESQVQAVAS